MGGYFFRGGFLGMAGGWKFQERGRTGKVFGVSIDDLVALE